MKLAKRGHSSDVVVRSVVFNHRNRRQPGMEVADVLGQLTAPESLTVAGGVVLMPSLMVAHLASRGLERVRNLSTLKRTVKKDPDESVNTGSSGSFCIQSLSSLPKAVHSPVPNKSA